MRSGHERIFDLWSDPTTQFIGENRASGYVTLDHAWYLNAQSTGLGNWPKPKAPIRWWQRADNSQTEETIPNVRSVQIDRDIAQDAATCTVSLNNQWMKTNFAVQLANELGYPGYFTFNRGRSSEARSRWQHVANGWSGKIVPGALIRTYQGYGGHALSREDAIDEGYITLTGAWIVDDVTISAKSGLIELNCRDMMALVIDQTLYPPLVPSGVYPIRYQRWIDTSDSPTYTPVKESAFATPTVVPCVYETSSADAWYGPNASIHGHHGTDSTDGNVDTYALSVGNSGPDKPFATDYFQYNTGGQMVGAIKVNCWQGGYQMFVSVMENGQWVGADTVDYDPSSLYATQTVVNTGANIHYLLQVGCPSDTPFEVALPRPYRADRIRISFRHLVNSGIGPWLYRAGVREFQALSSASAVDSAPVHVWWVASYMRDPDNTDRSGYILGTQSGIVAPFGLAREFAKTGGNLITNSHATWLEVNRAGDGYWQIRGDGSITTYGAAGYFGSPKDDGVGTNGSTVTPGIWWNVILITPTGQGYWAVATDGRIRAYGDATPYADVPDPAPEWIPGGGSLVSDQGILLAVTDGTVITRGAATHHGDWTKTDLSLDDGTADGFGNQMVTAVPTPTGDGYWLLASDGTVQERGAAVFHGQDVTTIENILDRFDQLVTNADGTGYLLVQTRGAVFPHGTIDFYGSAIGPATHRSDGNYRDYADIIKDLLLWSGFWLEEDLALNASPEVYGNIENTGIYSPDPLPPDMFDKKPVIDPINQIKEIVGYICWVDDEGGFRWESPNWWQAGNFWDTGGHTDFVPEIDEQIQLTDYKVRFAKDKERSEIIITTDEPTAGFTDTVTTRYTPSNSLLRGMSIPAMIKTPNQVTKDEQEIMAELIALHLWFARRIGNISCVANPGLQINDQVRIFERITAETFVHYIRGISSNHDFETGQYTMDITTNWLGTEDGNWAITAESVAVPVGVAALTAEEAADRFAISEKLLTFVNQLVKAPNTSMVPVTPSEDIDNPPSETGSANP